MYIEISFSFHLIEYWIATLTDALLPQVMQFFATLTDAWGYEPEFYFSLCFFEILFRDGIHMDYVVDFWTVPFLLGHSSEKNTVSIRLVCISCTVRAY